jgi:hypothetical protein
MPGQGLSRSSTISYGTRRPQTTATRKKNTVTVNVNRTATQIVADRRIYAEQLSSKCILFRSLDTIF